MRLSRHRGAQGLFGCDQPVSPWAARGISVNESRESIMFKRIDHVEIVTDQLDRTVQFYTELLGFPVKARARIMRSGLGVPIDLVYLDLGGPVVELISYEGGAVDPAPQTEHLGYRMMALEVDDMQKTADYLRTKGVVMVWGPKVRETYSRAEICDPNGYHIELRGGSGNPMRNERAGDPLSCRQMSPILTRWREWWCGLTESSG